MGNIIIIMSDFSATSAGEDRTYILKLFTCIKEHIINKCFMRFFSVGFPILLRPVNPTEVLQAIDLEHNAASLVAAGCS